MRSCAGRIGVISVCRAGVIALTIAWAAGPATARTIHWVGGSGDWDTTTANWLDGVTPTTFANGDDVVFDNTAGGTINLVGTVEPASTTFSAASGNYVVTAGAGLIGGTGPLTMSGGGRTEIQNINNAYTGGTFINSGELRVGVNFNSALGSGTVTLNDGTLRLNRFNPTNPLVVNGGTIYADNGFGNNWQGPVTLNAELRVRPMWNITFSGSIDGSGGLLVYLGGTQYGKVILTGANTYTGDTTVKDRVLKVNGNSINDSNKLIIDGGLVEPTGTEAVDTLWFGPIQQDAGTYGATGSGADNIDDTHFTGSAGVVQVLTGPPQVDADILNFGLPGYPGVITDTNVAWTVSPGFNVADLAPLYTVTFGASGIPPSGTARDFTTPQTYDVVSGDGSVTNTYRVTVTQGAVPSVFTWTNTVSGNWSAAANWDNNLATGTGPGYWGGSSYTLNFTTPGTYTATDDQNDGFLLNQLNFAAAVTINNPAGLNGVTLTTNGAALPQVNQNSGSAVTISVPLELGAQTTFGGTGNGWVTLQSPLSGAGSLAKTGSGTLNLTQNSTYSGGTVINGGTLQAGANLTTPFGSGPVILNNGILFLNRVYPSNSLTVFGGQLVASNGFGNNWSGAVALYTELKLVAYYNITFSGVLSGPGGLLIDPGGNTGAKVSLTAVNDYTGVTTVQDSILIVNGDSIRDENTLIIDGGKVEPHGTEIVSALYFGTEKQEPGMTYGATGSGADVIDDTRFQETTGVVLVMAPPTSGTVLFVR